MSLELAWAAGFFDGEGCTWYRERPEDNERISGASIGMQVSQSSLSNDNPPPELVRFLEAVKVGRYGKRNEARKDHYKYSWDWRVTTYKDVECVGSLLYPYLSQTKRKQFDDCMEKYKNSPSFGRPIGRPKGTQNRRKN